MNAWLEGWADSDHLLQSVAQGAAGGTKRFNALEREWKALYDSSPSSFLFDGKRL